MRTRRLKLGVRREQRRNQRGSALVLALIAVIAVSFMAMSFMQVSSAVTNRQALAMDNKVAFYLAEAGLAEGFTGVMVGKTGNVGTPTEPAVYGDGLLWVEATDLGDGYVDLESTAMSGSGKVTLSLVVQRPGVSVASLGMFSNGDLTINEGTLIDGYNSAEGSYRDQVQGLGSGGDGGIGFDEAEEVRAEDLGLARLRSNGNITINSIRGSPTTIGGNVIPGPGATATLNGDPTITGVVEPALASMDLPPVSPPNLGTPAAGVDHVNGLTLQVNAGDAAYEYLHVGANSSVVIQGPAVLNLGSLTLDPSAELTFDTTDGPIAVYVTGPVTMSETSQVSTTEQDTSRVSLLVSGENAVELSAAAQFFGSVYAPEGEVSISPTFELFGVAIADELALAAGARIHFDLYLAALSEQTAQPRHLSWRIIDMTPISAQPGANPFEILGVDENLLDPPADVHEDQVLDIKYVDLTGTQQSYSGLESAFPWDDVLVVVNATRGGVIVNDRSGAIDGSSFADAGGSIGSLLGN